MKGHETVFVCGGNHPGMLGGRGNVRNVHCSLFFFFYIVSSFSFTFYCCLHNKPFQSLLSVPFVCPYCCAVLAMYENVFDTGDLLYLYCAEVEGKTFSGVSICHIYVIV